MTYTAASHQEANRKIWLHFWGLLLNVVHFSIQSVVGILFMPMLAFSSQRCATEAVESCHW